MVDKIVSQDPKRENNRFKDVMDVLWSPYHNLKNKSNPNIKQYMAALTPVSCKHIFLSAFKINVQNINSSERGFIKEKFQFDQRLVLLTTPCYKLKYSKEPKTRK